ncbi:MAG: hypothetical protein KC646_10255 [Candidatus Cloacimonetes bacterium]|nr:hypothetical protein [Candidatus Cloacimonadota bacterium]
MSVINNAIKHFQKQERKEIEVPEWETTLYLPPMNLEERNRVYDDQNLKHDLAVEYLVLKAQNKEGQNVFAPADAFKLQNSVDPEIINKIFILGQKVEEIEKKSKDSEKINISLPNSK